MLAAAFHLLACDVEALDHGLEIVNPLVVDIAGLIARTVFERLFPPADKDQLKDAHARIALNKSVLDTAGASVKDFQKHLGADDKKRLDQYLESIREVEKRLDDSELILDRGRPKFDEEQGRLSLAAAAATVTVTAWRPGRPCK